VSDYFQNVDFSGDSLDIVNVDDLVLLEHLDGNLLTGERVCANHDLSEGSFAEVSAEHVVSDNFSLFCVFDNRILLVSIFLLLLLLLDLLHVGILLVEVDHWDLTSFARLRLDYGHWLLHDVFFFQRFENVRFFPIIGAFV
jgi:hypothetical protein